MTKSQRMSILLTRWPAACRAQGWSVSDRARRLQVISDAVGREVGSMNDLNETSDIDLVYAHLGRLDDQVAATVETLPAEPATVSAGRGRRTEQSDTLGYRRRILWLVRKHGQPLGGIPYVLSLARDKFHLVSGLGAIEDLSTTQLHQLMITLAARSSAQRRKAKAAEAELQPAVVDNAPF